VELGYNMSNAVLGYSDVVLFCSGTVGSRRSLKKIDNAKVSERFTYFFTHVLYFKQRFFSYFTLERGSL
jgi:hypothetical protein